MLTGFRRFVLSTAICGGVASLAGGSAFAQGEVTARAALEEWVAGIDALPEVAARRAGTEELTESRFSNLLRRSARQFVRCKPGDDTVKVTISLTVAPDGRVGNVRVTDDTPGGSGYLSRCVQRVVAAWQFPPQDRAQRLTRVMMLE